MQRFEDVLDAVLHCLASRNAASKQQMLQTRDDVFEVAVEQNARPDARVKCLNSTVDSLGDGFTGLRGHEGEEKRKKVRRPILLVGVSSKSQQNPENNGNYEL